MGHPVLEVAAGPGAGLSIPIGRIGRTVGRSRTADLTIPDPDLAARHFQVRRVGPDDVDVDDLDSPGGIRRNGASVFAGRSAFEIRDQRDRAAEPPPVPAPLATPDHPGEPGDPPPVPWLSALAPVGIGMAGAVLFHPMMLAMAVMSPVMLLGGWAERRRQLRRQQRRMEQEWNEKLQEFANQVGAVRAATEVRLRWTSPAPSALLRRGPIEPSATGFPVLLSTGLTDRAWDPSVEGAAAARPDIVQVLRTVGPLRQVPALIAVNPGDRLSVTGEGPAARALCRWLIAQAAVATPASDLAISVVIGGDGAEEGWMRRLPHVTSSSQNRITIGCHLAAPCVEIMAGSSTTGDGIPPAVAEELACRVAEREATPSQTALPPPGSSLAEGLGVELPTAEWILEQWHTASGMGLPTVLGMNAGGLEVIDLATEGPHTLIAGTTGSGKSQLLRAIVATTAALRAPTDVCFVLIDYKGGSAFDACAALPHVVGLITDLDPTLAERALRCLGSELRRREAHLRAAAVSDIAELAPGSLPRLCIVIDELAALVADLPTFADRLIGVAQRGRSLGVHLIMATQRPGGVLTPAIRANTNLRICLRVPDPNDSEDVIGDRAAAQIPTALPGRAWVRRGPEALSSVQGIDTTAPIAGKPGLAVVTTAAAQAWFRLGQPPPPCPWPEPLPADVALDELPEPDVGVGIGLADDPDLQSVDCLCWDPDAGHLVVVGAPRSGRTNALLCASQALAHSAASGRVAIDIIGIDAAGGGLDPLSRLAGCRSLLDLTSVEAISQLVDELAVRSRERTQPGAARTVVVVDGLGALLAALEHAGEYARISSAGRVWSDGPSRGICFVVSGDRPAAIPRELAASTATQIVLSLSDPLDHLLTGAPSAEDSRLPGRGREARTGKAVQLAMPRWG